MSEASQIGKPHAKPGTAKLNPPPECSFLKAKLAHPLGISLLLALATLLAYQGVRGHGFVDYDDGDYVSANPHVDSGLRWENVAWAFTTGHASNWHPLTWLSHMLDYQIFGRNPGAQHLVNLMLHAANTVLLFLVLWRMTGALWRGALVAALFALHPLHAESVAWLSERKDVLSTFFLMLTLGAYTWYAQSTRPRSKLVNPPEPSSRAGSHPDPTTSSQTNLPSAGKAKRQAKPLAAPGKMRLPATPDPSETGYLEAQPAGHTSFGYALALVFFALGLLSKPMLVTVPFLLLLLDYWPFKRVDLSVEPSNLRAIGALVVEKTPFLLLALGSSAITFVVQRKGGAVSTVLALNQRIENALVSYARYLGKMIWPEKLAVLYPHPGNWPLLAVLGAAVFLGVIFALTLWQARKRPYLAVGWLWFMGTLVPVIGLVQVGIQSMADRYTYVPLVGIFIACVWIVGELAQHWHWRREALVFVALVALLVCGLLTARQAGFWHDSEALFQHAVDVEPRNYLAFNNLGYYYANHGKPKEAMENYAKSLQINPNYEDALNNMGFAFAGQKNFQQAIGFYEQALRVRPTHVEVNNNLGNALSELGRLDEAILHYRTALKYDPNHADAHNNLGIALAMQGKLDEAIPNFRQAILLKRNYAGAHSNLGNALAAQQKFEEAMSQYQECLRLNPKDAQAHNNLANVLSQEGKFDEAVKHYSQALELNGDNPEAHFNLATVLARQGKLEEARSHYAESLRLRPDYTEARRRLEALEAK